MIIMAGVKKEAAGKITQASETALCTDKKCPKHSGLSVRGRTFIGSVASDKMSKTIVVSWPRRFFVKKFERYETRTSRINAHNPDCIGARKGDIVEITETKPLSKTKHFTVTNVVGKESAKELLKSETIEAEDAREELARRKEEAAEREGAALRKSNLDKSSDD
jgi:small subunit ribosomal protein S17